MNIETYGTGERMRYAASLARELTVPHLVLLPIPTTKDDQHIKGTDITLWQTLLGVGEGSCIFGYGLPEEYKSCAKSKGAKVFDLALDEEFLCENANITAVGTVGYLLTSTKRCLEGMHIGIIGYGRIGSALARLLLFFGANVRVYTSKILTRIDLGTCGIDTVAPPDASGGVWDFSGLDILINTAPRDIKEAFAQRSDSDPMRILELASGENFSGVCGVERLPALPEKMYPESAAEAYIRAARRLIS